MWAGLNIDPRRPSRRRHPLLPDRAAAGDHADLAVRRAAQRRDRPAQGGCIRWQHDGHAVPRRHRRSPRPPTPSACWTSPPTRPAPRSPSRSTRWSARPSRRGRPSARTAEMLDRKTGERADFLFAFRARHVAKTTSTTHHPVALPQGWRPGRRRPRQHHQPPGPLDHRQPALQRQGTDDAVRAAGLARSPLARAPPSTTPRSPRTR